MSPGPSLRARLAAAKEWLLTLSLRAALREQGLDGWVARLEAAQPDIRGHYTTFALDSEYLRVKVRGQHAFQTALAAAALGPGASVVADVGDSSGTHVAYLQALFPRPGRRFLSVNLDPVAVSKIRARGLEAVEARAEDLGRLGLRADVVLCFETLEHLPDPATFLHELSREARVGRLVLTVPFVRASRVGLHHLRAGLRKEVGAESTHLFELCPADLRLLALHCGWRVEHERTYLQYPRRSWLRCTRPAWRRFDFEGFYGAVLVPDDSWSSLYKDWR